MNNDIDNIDFDEPIATSKSKYTGYPVERYYKTIEEETGMLNVFYMFAVYRDLCRSLAKDGENSIFNEIHENLEAIVESKKDTHDGDLVITLGFNFSPRPSEKHFMQIFSNGSFDDLFITQIEITSVGFLEFEGTENREKGEVDFYYIHRVADFDYYESIPYTPEKAPDGMSPYECAIGPLLARTNLKMEMIAEGLQTSPLAGQNPIIDSHHHVWKHSILTYYDK